MANSRLQPSWRQTPVIYSIIALNLAVYLVLHYGLPAAVLPSNCFGGLQPYWILRQGEYWRLFSSIFVHYDFSHLAFNMLALLIFGSYAEKILGRPLTVLVYLSCGIFANLVALYLFNASQFYCAIGASGAILGLVAATGCLMWALGRRGSNFAAAAFAGQLAIILVIQFMIDLFVPSSSLVHHFSGALMGLLLALILLPRLLRT